MNWPRNKVLENFGNTALLRNHPLHRQVELQEAHQGFEFRGGRTGTNGRDPMVLTGAQASEIEMQAVGCGGKIS
jgi:hypothetical protein